MRITFLCLLAVSALTLFPTTTSLADNTYAVDLSANSSTNTTHSLRVTGTIRVNTSTLTSMSITNVNLVMQHFNNGVNDNTEVLNTLIAPSPTSTNVDNAFAWNDIGGSLVLTRNPSYMGPTASFGFTNSIGDRLEFQSRQGTHFMSYVHNNMEDDNAPLLLPGNDSFTVGQQVPEPAAAVFTAGLLGGLLIRRRRKK